MVVSPRRGTAHFQASDPIIFPAPPPPIPSASPEDWRTCLRLASLRNSELRPPASFVLWKRLPRKTRACAKVSSHSVVQETLSNCSADWCHLGEQLCYGSNSFCSSVQTASSEMSFLLKNCSFQTLMSQNLSPRISYPSEKPTQNHLNPDPQNYKCPPWPPPSEMLPRLSGRTLPTTASLMNLTWTKRLCADLLQSCRASGQAHQLEVHSHTPFALFWLHCLLEPCHFQTPWSCIFMYVHLRCETSPFSEHPPPPNIHTHALRVTYFLFSQFWAVYVFSVCLWYHLYFR